LIWDIKNPKGYKLLKPFKNNVKSLEIRKHTEEAEASVGGFFGLI
jgi:hypothetical protein